jgi:DNA-binding NarL/FixJ family response regulator
MIRVVIADDQALVRSGLARLLENAGDIDVVGTAASGPEAVALAGRERPHVVLMDLSMPGGDGITATRELAAAADGVHVVILTSFVDRPRILEALDAGAIGYLLKDAEPDELYRGVRAAARGDSPLAPQAAKALIAARREPARDTRLSEREREVLALLAEGHANKVIARRLGIAEKTVRNHVTRIFDALGVSDRTQAALWAQRQRLP